MPASTLMGSYVRRPSPSVVEIRAGTGVFSAAMATWLGAARVLAVDPSEAMLVEARLDHPHPMVDYVAGSADAVPSAGGVFGVGDPFVLVGVVSPPRGSV